MQKQVALGMKRFIDQRGWFAVNWDSSQRLDFKPVQSNVSFSYRNVFRGLHLQTDQEQAKLVTVLEGKIIDYIIDCRLGPSFGSSSSYELSDSSRNQAIFVPKGFAHGFYVVSDSALVQYFVDAYYDPGSEVSILPRSIQAIAADERIDWGSMVCSDKDSDGLNIQMFESCLEKKRANE